MQEQQSITEFLKNNLIDFVCEESSFNDLPKADQNIEWINNNRAIIAHYRITLIRKNDRRKRFTSYFHCGENAGQPTLENVLDCFALESATVENSRHFKDFCDELGYSDDSIRSLNIYKLSQKNAKRLKKFLGLYAYEDLLFNTERL